MSAAVGKKLTPDEINHIDPCAFMVDVASHIPVVAHYALELLSIPAAEAECERLFSLAGIVLSETRSRMLPANANKLCLLNRWLPDREKTTLAAATMKAKKATRDKIAVCTAKAVTVALNAICGTGSTSAPVVIAAGAPGAALTPVEAAAPGATTPTLLQGLPLDDIFEEVIEMSAAQVLAFTSTTETEDQGLEVVDASSTPAVDEYTPDEGLEEVHTHL